MAYFPNGTSQQYYEETYCDRCRHGVTLDNPEGCRVMTLHLAHNYEALDNPDIKNILDALIPMDGLDAKKCTMFLPWDEDRCHKTPDMFRLERGE